MTGTSCPEIDSPWAEQRLAEAALKLAFRADYETICRTVLDVIEAMFDAHSSWILLHDRRSNRLVSAAARGRGRNAYAHVAIPPDAGIVGLAFSTGEPVFVPEVLKDTRWFDPAALHQSGMSSVLTVPLLYGRQRVGVIGFESPRFGPESLPSTAARELVRGIGALATLALTNARLQDDLDAERRRRARLHQRKQQLMTEVNHLRHEVRVGGSFGSVIGGSKSLERVLEQVALVAPTDATVLLMGETGTGKELIARAIHDDSQRARAIFIAVNCAALPSTLVESELFGHEKGAFTGAVERKPGKFELAESGTIFLDEIGELPLEAQSKLLRVLQEREITRVGGTRSVSVNTRVIAASNQDLLMRVQSGLFRSDLYYRLNVFPIELPPLRERREDIPDLVEHFVQQYADRLHSAPPMVEPDAMDQLVAYDWPGNVRELQNVVERAVILARGHAIGCAQIPTTRAQQSASPSSPDASSQPTQPPEDGGLVGFAEAERRAIIHALNTAGWRISGRGGAAEILGLKPTTLHAKMRKLGVSRPSPFKRESVAQTRRSPADR